MRRSLVFGVVAVLAWYALAGSLRADVANLLASLPDGVNTVIVIRAKEIFSTPIAAKLGWAKRAEAAFQSHSVLLPPGAQDFVLGAQLDLDSMDPVWQAALVDSVKAVDMNTVARSFGGAVERLGAVNAVRIPQNAFILSLGPQRVGVLSPAERQTAARWAKSAAGGRGALPEYLARSTSDPQRTGQIVLALELADSIPPQFIRNKLPSADALKGRKVDLNELAQVLSGIQGITLSITADEKLSGKLWVDFSGDIASLADFAKPLLLEALSGRGASIDDFAKWTANVAGSTLTMSGELSQDSLSTVLSLIELPSTAVDAAAGDTSGQAGSGTSQEADARPTAQASKEHFTKVVNELKRLKFDVRDAKTIGQSAQWMDRSARRIGQLPILSVDPELLDYSASVSAALRDASMAVKGSGIRSAVGEAQYQGGGYYRDSYGGLYYDDVNADRRRVRKEEQGTAAMSVQDIAQKVKNDTDRIRRTMTQRYRVEF